MAATTTVEYLIKLRDSLNPALKKANANTKKLDKLMSALGKNIVTVVSLAAGVTTLKRATVKAVTTFANFEKQMSAVKAVTGATEEDFKRLEDKAIEMGSSTAFTATQSAEAMEKLGMAGFNTNEILSALPSTLDLAAAGGVDLAKAADISSNVLAGFGLSASEAGRASDLIAFSASKANVSVESMGESFKEIASTAKVVNVSMEEVAAIINTLGNAGIKGTNATNTLQSSILRLADAPRKARDAMKRLEVNFFDAEGQFIGMTKTIKLLERRFKTLTKEERLAAVSQIFGKTSANQWLSALGATKDVIVKDLTPATKELLGLTDELGTVTLKGSQVLDFYTSELNDASGAAKKMAETRLDNLAGDFTILQSATEGATIALMKKISPALRSVVQGLTETIELIRESEVLFKSLGAAALVLGTAYVIMNAKMLATLVYTKLLTAAQWLFNIAMNANPISLIVIGLAALAAGFVQLWHNSESFRSVVLSLWEGIKDLWDMIVGFAKNLKIRFQALGDAIMQSSFVKGLKWIGDKIASLFKTTKKLSKLRTDTPASSLGGGGSRDAKTEPKRLDGEGGDSVGSRDRMAQGTGSEFESFQIPGFDFDSFQIPKLGPNDLIKTPDKKGGDKEAQDTETQKDEVIKSRSIDDRSKDITGVSSVAPKNVTINIGKFFDNFIIKTQNITESKAEIKKAVTMAVLDAVNDVSLTIEK